MRHCIFLLLAATPLFLFACTGKVPEGLGVRDGRFAACPGDSGCVSSQAGNEAHRVAPIAARGGVDVVMVDLARSIESMFGGRVMVMDGPYLRAEFTGRLFRFVDDLECYYDQGRGVVEVRSQSRVGNFDFHANRNRVEELREAFTRRRSR